MNEKVEKALNEQINAELYSAYLYLAMSAYFEANNMPGFANWMYVQYQEETTHGLKLYKYIVERGGTVTLAPIQEPPKTWKDTQDVFSEVLKHEQLVTSLINNLVDLALVEKDHATNNMLQWFVAEQVEEEANAMTILGQIKMLTASKESVYLVDKELGARVFVDSTQSASA
jgi:ferritin